MTTTPTEELSKYESLLLMIVASNSPYHVLARRDRDAVSNAVARDLVLVKCIVAQFVIVNDIECRKAIGDESRLTDMHTRGRCRGGFSGAIEHTREPYSELEALAASKDAEAFKKYLQKEAHANFSLAMRQRLGELAHEKAKEKFSENIVRLGNEVADAQSRLEIAKAELASTELVHKKTIEALKKFEEAEEATKIF